MAISAQCTGKPKIWSTGSEAERELNFVSLTWKALPPFKCDVALKYMFRITRKTKAYINPLNPLFLLGAQSEMSSFGM